MKFQRSMLLDKNSQLTVLRIRYKIMAEKCWVFSVLITGHESAKTRM